MSEAPPLVSQAAVAEGRSVISREEKVEYRDQDGNLLNPEEVKSLEGKVSFKTRYETRTRLVDAQGNEIKAPEEAVPVAPPHPDVDNVDQQTPGVPEVQEKKSPSSPRDVTLDDAKEESIDKLKKSVAKPASEGNDATAA